MRPTRPRLTAKVLLGAGLAAACGGGSTAQPAAQQPVRDLSERQSPDRDQSRCDFEGRVDREVVESRGPGALHPNVRRVFAILGEGEDRRRVLLCREVDTNLDGVKDVVRLYDDKGEPVEEKADSSYNGQIDTWITFSRGRIAKLERDNSGDGRPDEFRYYIRGKLSRIQRDTNGDGKPDVWEMYVDGRLDRMGVDLNHDGHVDRWDRDAIARRLADEKEREEEERREREKAEKEDDQDAAAAEETREDAE